MAKPDELKAALEAVPEATKAARLRQVMPVILRRIDAGASYESLVEALNAQGVELTLNTFKSYVYRWRKKHPQPAAAAPAQPIQQAGPGQPVRQEAEPAPAQRLRTRGDLQKLRTRDFDLDDLAEQAKGKE